MRILQGHTGPVRCVAYDPGGELLASGGDDHSVRLWDIAKGAEKKTLGEHTDWGKQISTLRHHDDWVRSLAVAPNGVLAASCADDAIVALWSLPRGKLQRQLTSHSAAVGQVAFCPDGNTLLSVSWDGTARLWD